MQNGGPGSMIAKDRASMGLAPATPPESRPVERNLFVKLRNYGSGIIAVISALHELIDLPDTLRKGEGVLPVIGNALLRTGEFAIIWILAVILVSLGVSLVCLLGSGWDDVYQLIIILVAGTLISISLFFAHGFMGSFTAAWDDVTGF